jgi:hypothetical protein
LGLDLYITELTVRGDDNSQKNDFNYLLNYFAGKPAIKGIILWSFWEEDPDSLQPRAHILRYNFSERPAAKWLRENFLPNYIGRRASALSSVGVPSCAAWFEPGTINSSLTKPIRLKWNFITKDTLLKKLKYEYGGDIGSGYIYDLHSWRFKYGLYVRPTKTQTCLLKFLNHNGGVDFSCRATISNPNSIIPPKFNPP